MEPKYGLGSMKIKQVAIIFIKDHVVYVTWDEKLKRKIDWSKLELLSILTNIEFE